MGIIVRPDSPESMRRFADLRTLLYMEGVRHPVVVTLGALSSQVRATQLAIEHIHADPESPVVKHANGWDAYLSARCEEIVTDHAMGAFLIAGEPEDEALAELGICLARKSVFM
ncbi:hypothetical protein ER308_15470 [Egibacter rhizosphaerae]|uniref:Uncharacterized protein n=1 Tax=Egibacter rhizosphaerae TaxID=1670831 RepID=A0A411YHW7_9ACTN|nr:hypothetical protein [Egibacter rhizosphaerae]QBI20830.1 hypothetical protein ER308_15470 [Egibacter rhizosphaerae]